MLKVQILFRLRICKWYCSEWTHPSKMQSAISKYTLAGRVAHRKSNCFLLFMLKARRFTEIGITWLSYSSQCSMQYMKIFLSHYPISLVLVRIKIEDTASPKATGSLPLLHPSNEHDSRVLVPSVMTRFWTFLKVRSHEMTLTVLGLFPKQWGVTTKKFTELNKKGCDCQKTCDRRLIVPLALWHNLTI